MSRPRRPSPHVQAVIDALPPEDVKAAARRLQDHLGHGGLRVELPDSWCGCGTNLGPALLIKAGELLLMDLIDEIMAAR